MYIQTVFPLPLWRDVTPTWSSWKFNLGAYQDSQAISGAGVAVRAAVLAAPERRQPACLSGIFEIRPKWAIMSVRGRHPRPTKYAYGRFEVHPWNSQFHSVVCTRYFQHPLPIIIAEDAHPYSYSYARADVFPVNRAQRKRAKRKSYPRPVTAMRLVPSPSVPSTVHRCHPRRRRHLFIPYPPVALSPTSIDEETSQAGGRVCSRARQ